MSAQLAPEIETRWELWRSFESCIRSYAAVEGLSDAETPKVVAFGDHIDVTWHGVYLGFTMRPGDGTAVWLIEWHEQSSMWGGFQLLPEGSFLIGETRKEIDLAAIDFLLMLKKHIEAGRGSSGLSPVAARKRQKGPELTQ